MPLKRSSSTHQVQMKPKEAPKPKHKAPGPKTGGGGTTTTTMPAAVNTSVKPYWKPNGNKILAREIIQEVTVPSTPAAWYKLINTPVNIGNPYLFKKGSVVAQDYERFKFKSLKFIFAPLGNTTQSVTVAGMYDYDPADIAPSSLIELLTAESCCYGGSMTKLELPLRIANDAYKQYFVSSTVAMSTDSDVRTKSPAAVSFYLDHWTAATATAPIGTLWVEYDVEFHAERMPEPSGIGWTNALNSAAGACPAVVTEFNRGYTLESYAPTWNTTVSLVTLSRNGGNAVTQVSGPAIILNQGTYDLATTLYGGGSFTGQINWGVALFDASNNTYLATAGSLCVNPIGAALYRDSSVLVIDRPTVLVPWNAKTNVDTTWVVSYRLYRLTYPSVIDAERMTRPIRATMPASAYFTLPSGLPDLQAYIDEHPQCVVNVLPYETREDEKVSEVEEVLRRLADKGWTMLPPCDELPRQGSATPAPTRPRLAAGAPLTLK